MGPKPPKPRELELAKLEVWLRFWGGPTGPGPLVVWPTGNIRSAETTVATSFGYSLGTTRVNRNALKKGTIKIVVYL